VHSFTLQMASIWQVYKKIEDRLCYCDGFDEDGESISCSLEAVEGDEQDTIEYAKRYDVV